MIGVDNLKVAHGKKGKAITPTLCLAWLIGILILGYYTFYLPGVKNQTFQGSDLSISIGYLDSFSVVGDGNITANLSDDKYFFLYNDNAVLEGAASPSFKPGSYLHFTAGTSSFAKGTWNVLYAKSVKIHLTSGQAITVTTQPEKTSLIIVAAMLYVILAFTGIAIIIWLSSRKRNL